MESEAIYTVGFVIIYMIENNKYVCISFSGINSDLGKISWSSIRFSTWTLAIFSERELMFM